MTYDYITNDALVYDALFRHYRNAFVDHVRQCLLTELNGQAAVRLKAIFNSEWDGIVARANQTESAGSVQRSRIDDFDYLDIAYFERVIDHFYDHLVDERWKGANAITSKRSLIAWVREVKGTRDPAAHPGAETMDIRDAIRAVDTARRVLERLGTVEGKSELTDIQNDLILRSTRVHEIGSAAPLDDSLPTQEAIVNEFVGRGSELEQLRAFLRHPRKKRWLLVGDGGKGKTAIAYTFAREVIEASPPGLCAVFWLSAKRRKYQLDRVVDIPSPDFSNLTECVDRLLISYGHHDALSLTLDDRREEVLKLLNDLPILLVADDLDSVSEENEDVIEFLTLDVPQTNSNVLFTSRRKFAGMGANTTIILGLPEDEALEFVGSRWEGDGFDKFKLGLPERKKIVDVCEGSPLYMGDLMRLIASVAARTGGFNPRSIISDWSSHQGDSVRRYALQREMEMLTEKARRVLDSIAVAGRAVTVEEIAVLTAYSEQIVSGSVDELRQLYLLTAPALEEEVPRFQLNGNLAILVRSELADTPREKELTAAYRALEGEEPALGQRTPIRDITRQARLLINGKRLSEAERLLQRAIEEYPASSHLLALLGFVYIDWEPRRIADARRLFERAAQLRHDDRAMFLAWSRIEYESGHWDKAIDAAEAGMRNRPKKDPMLMQSAARAHIGKAKAFRAAFHESKSAEAFAAADQVLQDAVGAAKGLRLRALDISLLYRDWVHCARLQHREGAVCARLVFWEKWRPFDRNLQLEIAEHSAKCSKGVH